MKERRKGGREGVGQSACRSESSTFCHDWGLFKARRRSIAVTVLSPSLSSPLSNCMIPAARARPLYYYTKLACWLIPCHAPLIVTTDEDTLYNFLDAAAAAVRCTAEATRSPPSPLPRCARSTPSFCLRCRSFVRCHKERKNNPLASLIPPSLPPFVRVLLCVPHALITSRPRNAKQLDQVNMSIYLTLHIIEFIEGCMKLVLAAEGDPTRESRDLLERNRRR